MHFLAAHLVSPDHSRLSVVSFDALRQRKRSSESIRFVAGRHAAIALLSIVESSAILSQADTAVIAAFFAFDLCLCIVLIVF